jgi:hypothetical protein
MVFTTSLTFEFSTTACSAICSEIAGSIDWKTYIKKSKSPHINLSTINRRITPKIAYFKDGIFISSLSIDCFKFFLVPKPIPTKA